MKLFKRICKKKHLPQDLNMTTFRKQKEIKMISVEKLSGKIWFIHCITKTKDCNNQQDIYGGIGDIIGCE